MRARDRARWAALALGVVVTLGGCVIDARLGALDGDDGDDDPEVSSDPSDPGAPGHPGDSCGPDSVPPPDPNVLDGLVPGESTAVITDCGAAAGYDAVVSTWRATSAGATKLWVGGVYQTRDDHFGGYHPLGEGFITWAIPGSNVLVISSYEPTHWTLELEPGGELERIVALGYHVQTVDAPEGVIVETYAHEAGNCVWSCGFALPGSGGGCEGEELVAAAEHVTGLELYAFDGCYDATTFEYSP